MTNHYKEYTTGDIRFLRQNRDCSNKELAELMGRSRLAICKLREKYKTPRYPRYTEADLQTIRDNLHLSDSKIGDMLGRSTIAITLCRKNKGIQK